jgi:hypothetical protein
VIAALLICAVGLAAQAPVRLEYICPPEDIEAFGLTCSPEDPCPVFLELAGVEAVGARLFLTGNLHTASTTLFGILEVSEDGGQTWMEPAPRQRATALDQIQFLDFTHGWISGQHIEPLPRDPFMMLTDDGGKTWRNRPLFDDERVGSISQFWFDSRSTGELVFDRSQGTTIRQELYETMTGGESWTVKEVSNRPLHLAKARPKESAAWRLRVDAPTKTYRVERRSESKWDNVASFIVQVASCQ